MCQLVESLKLKDGVLENLAYHQARLNRSMAELVHDAKKIVLSEAIHIPVEFGQGLYKVRVVYRETVEKIEMEPYHIRNVQSLKVVRHESIDYHLKYTDRQILQRLFAQRGDCDDIIIVKNGQVTDAFSANLLFFDGQKWVTPDSPLLEGTQRQFLLDRGIITEQQISEKDISNFQKIGLINAMMSFDEMPVIPLEKIYNL